MEPEADGCVFTAPGHLVLPAFPLCIGRLLSTGQETGPSFSLQALHRVAELGNLLPPPRALLEEERLADDRGHVRRLERLGDQEGGLRPLAGEEAFRIGRDEDDRNLEALQ